MSLAFDSPNQMNNANEAYFTPLNMPSLLNTGATKENDNTTNNTASTPFYTAPINPAINQEFLNAIQARHASQPIILSTPVNTSENKGFNLNLNPSIAMRRNVITATPVKQPVVTACSILLPMEPSSLNQIVDKAQLLILDVRSFVQYSHSRIRGAINISIPNTILRRPTFTLDKVSEAIVQDQAREKLKSWESAECIVFYDQQSNILQENSAAAYLGTKLLGAGFKGKLHYVKGGFEAFFSQFSTSCESSNTDLGVTQLGPPTVGGDSFSLKLPVKAGGKPKLRLGNMPMATPSIGPFTAPMPQFENQAFNPFFSNIRQNMELSHGPIRERFPIRLPLKCNVNLDQKNVTIQCAELSPRQVAGCHLNNDSFLPPTWLQNTINEQGTQLLAETYEKIERTEQRRLQNIMHYHSKHTDNPAEYPFSIVAGIEMGALNRYTNIWPYEYTRVKLQYPKCTDYINASYIQYIDSKESISDARPGMYNTECVKLMKENKVNQPFRRYISTQGPLPATFQDFWQMVWEQDSRVVVMLTKEEEMNKIKCHRYWPSELNTPTNYGDIVITLMNETTHPVPVFNNQVNEDDVVIAREFLLVYGDQSKQVTHLHYTGWMDFGVPDNPLGTLQIIHMVNEAQSKYQETGPMVVHCSAGCGRSGAFCAIDTVLYRLNDTSSKQHDILLETISRLREQRLSMVQTLRQFVFCYEVVWWWLLGYGPKYLYQSNVEKMDIS